MGAMEYKIAISQLDQRPVYPQTHPEDFLPFAGPLPSASLLSARLSPSNSTLKSSGDSCRDASLRWSAYFICVTAPALRVEGLAAQETQQLWNLSQLEVIEHARQKP